MEARYRAGCDGVVMIVDDDDHDDDDLVDAHLMVVSMGFFSIINDHHAHRHQIFLGIFGKFSTTLNQHLQTKTKPNQTKPTMATRPARQ